MQTTVKIISGLVCWSFIVLVCAIGCDSTSTHQSSSSSISDQDKRRIKVAKLYLLSALKSPTTANISVVGVESGEGGIHVVGGRVTAVNSFNAPITSVWIVLLDTYEQPKMLYLDGEIYIKD